MRLTVVARYLHPEGLSASVCRASPVLLSWVVGQSVSLIQSAQLVSAVSIGAVGILVRDFAETMLNVPLPVICRSATAHQDSRVIRTVAVVARSYLVRFSNDVQNH